MSEREDDLAFWLNTATKTIAAAWAALGYRPNDVPMYSLAEAIKKKLAEKTGATA